MFKKQFRFQITIHIGYITFLNYLISKNLASKSIINNLKNPEISTFIKLQQIYKISIILNPFQI